MLITWKGQNYDFCQVKTGQCHNMKPLSLPPLKPLTEFHLKKRIAATRSDYCYKTFGRKWQLHAETFLNTCTLYTRVWFCCTVLYVLGSNWDLEKIWIQFLGASSISAGTRGATCWSQCGKRQRTRLPGQPSGIWNDNALKCPHHTVLGSIAFFSEMTLSSDFLTFGRARERDFWCWSRRQGKRRGEPDWKCATPELVI